MQTVGGAGAQTTQATVRATMQTVGGGGGRTTMQATVRATTQAIRHAASEASRS